MFDNLSFREKIAAGVIMLVLVTAIVNSGSPVLIFMLIFFLMSFLRRRQGPDRRPGVRLAHQLDDDEIFNERTVRLDRSAYSEHIHQHAIHAVHAAGHNPDDLPVLPMDLGMIVFFNNEAPAVYRTSDVPDDADYIQPFVELRVPVDATGKVRFELLDAQGKPVFVHEDYHELRRGRNLISPSARLPIHDELELDTFWRLNVYGDGVLLVRHEFMWQPMREQPGTHIRKHIGEDGEISSELRAIMAESRLQPLSLDDLLADQEEAAQQQRR